MATPLRALLVEDLEDDALLLVRELQRAGYEISYERVDSANAMETALRRGAWDVVISDHGMPAFSGTEALALLRRMAPDVPFIFVSGSIGEDVAVAAMRAGAQDYVMKGNIRRLAPAIARELHDADGRRRERLAKEQLRATSEMLRSVFAASPLAIIATDLDFNVKLWNPAAERLFGWTESEVIGKPNPIVPPSRHAEGSDMRERAAQGQSFSYLEVERRHRDGTPITVSISVAATHDGAGHPDGLTAVIQDLTERKRLEAQFLQAQKMEAVGRLAGGVAHDFNNLLTVIASYTELLLVSLPAHDPSRPDLGEIKHAAAAATALTRQLLTFSRKQEIQVRVVELNAVVAGASNLLKRLIGANVELDVQLDPNAGSIRADSGQIEQVIMNLAVNARDAMPAGGTLTIQTRRITPAAGDGRGPRALLAISDTGTGIEKETQARIFEPFFTTKAEDKGTGLGLATVASIVKQYDGEIVVDSTVGVGTTFSVFLPSASGR